MTLRSHGMHFTNCLKLYLIMVGIITDAYRKTISMYFPSPSSYLHWLLGNSEALNSSSPKRKDFANKGPHSQSYGFSTGHVRVGHKEGWASKNWCFWTVGLGNTLESPLDSKEIKQISPKGNQPWIFIGRTDAETGAPIFWPPDAKNQLTGKDPDAGKDWGQEGKGSDRGWFGWTASPPTQWSWVWANSRRQWRTGKPGMLQSTGSQTVGHDFSNWTVATTKRKEAVTLSPFLMVLTCSLLIAFFAASPSRRWKTRSCSLVIKTCHS